MITKKDLIGDIADFPIEVVEKMLERQVKQRNKENVKVFQKDRTKDDTNGGFTWRNTIEGYDFWTSVIREKKFDIFFSKYPQRKETNTISINKSTKVKLNFKL